MKIQLSEHFTFKKLIQFVLPSIIMMIFTSIYSVVDGLFVSNYAGKTALAAINLILPLLMGLSALGFMIGTGGSAIVAKTLGEGKKKEANEYFSMLVYITLGGGILLAILGALIVPFIATALGATGELHRDCVIYARITFISMPAFMLQNVFQSFFVAAEKPKLGLGVIVTAGLTNMVLDYLFVGVLGYGLIGAAVATVCGEMIGGCFPILYFGRKNSSLLRLGKTHFDIKVLAKTCTNGISEFVSSIAGSIVGVCYNAQLLAYIGPKGVSAYGVIMYMAYVFSAIFMGYSIGISPIVSYHYGAENKKELHGLLVKSLIIIAIASLAMFGLSQGIGPLFARAFCEGDAELLQITNVSIRIYSFVFLVCGFSIFGSGFFTALNNGLISTIISLVRALVFELIFVWTFPLIWGVTGIWVSAPCAEIASAILTSCCFLIGWKKYGY